MKLIHSGTTTGGSAPSWAGKYVVPPGSCEACARHLHHKCAGADLLTPDRMRAECPCPCGHCDNELLLNAAAWDDLARHVPWAAHDAAQHERMVGGRNVTHLRESRRKS